MEADRLVSLSEVGLMLGRRSIKTVRRMMAAGNLPKPVYVGRTPMLFLSDVVGYIEELKETRRAVRT